MLQAEEVGERPRKRLDLLVEQALGHYDQWFVSKTSRSDEQGEILAIAPSGS
jgi:hypothetical protein